MSPLLPPRPLQSRTRSAPLAVSGGPRSDAINSNLVSDADYGTAIQPAQLAAGTDSQSPPSTTLINSGESQGRSRMPNRVTDAWNRTRNYLTGESNLCTICRTIQFSACATGRPSPTSHDGHGVSPDLTGQPVLTELTHLLDMRESCPCCKLLLQCLRTPENDLFRPGFIKDYLNDSESLKAIDSFDSWLKSFSSLRRLIEGEDIWPFGYTSDLKEAARSMKDAKELYMSAEERDLSAERVDATAFKRDTMADALGYASLGMDAIDVANYGRARAGERFFSTSRLATHRAALMFKGARRPLPCYLVIRGYRVDGEKAGAVSVRCFGFGRAPRAVLQEICHFSLRIEGSWTPRLQGKQLWYGRKLKPTVDVEFFTQCLDSCKDVHGDVCGQFRYSPQSDAMRKHADWTFRLVDVENKSIVETTFEEIVKPQYNCPYVTLSYTWGLNSQAYLTLTKWNLEVLRKPQALALGEVPATIRNAMDVVRRMGLKYLWVDRLCIPQSIRDEEVHPDNPANIAHMGRIYGEALFTIVAGSSRGMDDGLCGMIPGRNVSEQVVNEVSPGLSLFLPAAASLEIDIWESRAWTFQEKVLSRRLLVFSGGFAFWRCRCALWREDVNALDGDITLLSFPWLDIQPLPRTSEISLPQRYGLMTVKLDGSLRLFRTPAFRQYVQCVTDLSRRSIGDQSDILEASQGIFSVLGSKELLDSPFLHGLPRRFMDLALLWLPHGRIRRRSRSNDQSYDQSTKSHPSWSWAGWESTPEPATRGSSSFVTRDSKGPDVFYRTPFDVLADEEGLRMRLNVSGEERLRPWAHLYIVRQLESGHRKLAEVGMLGAPWFTKHQSWDCTFPQLSPSISLHGLSDRHIVVHTEIASLQLISGCTRVKRTSHSQSQTYWRETLESGTQSRQASSLLSEADEVLISKECWIFDTKAKENAGIALYHGNNHPPHEHGAMKSAILLSEEQYLGNEERVDVHGYPLYNILIIERNTEGFMERVGLGKVSKTAWARATPKLSTVVLA